MFKKLLRRLPILLGAMVMALTTSVQTFAQCAMCKTSIAGSADAARLSNKIDLGVLILLLPVLFIAVAIAMIVYRYRNSFGESKTEPGEQVIEIFVSEVDSTVL